jgi:Tfp pilus assembly protein PilO
MNRSVPDLRRLLRRAGWPALVAGLLVLVAILLYALGVRALQREVADLKLQAEAARTKLRSGSLATRKAPATVAEQLRTFQAFFPRADSLPHWLDTIHTIGRGSGLLIRSGEYRLERPEQGPWRYHVTLPVSGSYLQVRQFITFVLREVPSASLDDVQLRRDAGSERVDARLRFSLHFIGS